LLRPSLLLLLWGLLRAAGLAAQVPLSGQVIDQATRQPIARANVQLLSPTTPAVVAFAIADAQGKFSLPPQKAGPYVLKVTAVGYLAEEKLITLSEEKNTFWVELNTDKARVLKEIVIDGYPPSTFKVRGDTIFYNPEAVRDGTEKNLGELLKKLPGISVDEAGKVSYNGEPIKKIMVENNDFFGNKHQMATQNLPAKMVKEIELHTDYKESQLDASQNGKVMNLKLYDEYKGRPVGNLSAGAGNRYQAHSNLFFFGSGGNKALISDFNNTGELPMTEADYYEMRGGLLNLNDISESRTLQPSTEGLTRPRFILSNINLATKNSQFSAFNWSKKIKNTTKIEVFAYANRIGQTDRTTRQETFIASPVGFNEQLTNRSSVGFGSLLAKIRHEPDSNRYLQYDLTVNPSADNMTEALVNNRAVGAINVNTDLRNRNFNLGQRLRYIRRVAPRWIWESRVAQNFTAGRQSILLQSVAPLLDLPFADQNYRLEQPLFTQNQYYTLRSELRHRRRQNQQFAFFAATEYLRQAVENRWETPTEALPQNDFRVRNGLAKMGFNWQQGLGRVADLKFTLQGLYLHHLWHQQEATADQVQASRWLAEPHLAVSRRVGEGKLTLDWSLANNFAAADQLLSGLLITDYRSQRQNGNVTGSQPTRTRMLRANYGLVNPFMGTMLMVNLAHSRLTNQVLNVVESTSPNAITTRTVFVPQQDRWFLFVNFDRKFRRLPLGFKNNLSYQASQGDNFEGAKASRFRSSTFSYRGQVYTAFSRPVFQAELGLQFSQFTSRWELSERSNTFRNWQPYTKFRGKAGQLVWELVLEYRYQTTGLTSNGIFFINPSLRYTPKDSRSEWFINGNNVANLGKNQILTAIFTNNGVTISERAILSGYLLAGYKWSF
jgi:hypothetical protein